MGWLWGSLQAERTDGKRWSHPGRMEDSGAKFSSMVEMAERGSGGMGIGALGAWP